MVAIHVRGRNGLCSFNTCHVLSRKTGFRPPGPYSGDFKGPTGDDRERKAGAEHLAAALARSTVYVDPTSKFSLINHMYFLA